MPLKNNISVAVLLALGLSLSTPVQGQDSYNYTVAAGYAPQTLSGGESGKSSPRFVLSSGFTGSVSRRLGSHFHLRLDFLSGTVYDDSSASSIFQLGSESANRISGFRSRRVSATLQFSPFSASRRITPSVGFGLGIDFWRFLDPSGDSTLDTLSDRNTPRKFDAEELILTTFAGWDVALGSQLALSFEGRADYLTGPGAEFADIVNDSRPRWAFSLSARLQFSFGLTTKKERWRSDETWSQAPPASADSPHRSVRDSDGDGVEDNLDKCPSTAAGAIVNSLGCPMDSDGDGVFDGLDDCPDTPPGALGAVDIYGCPIDSDFDGVPDFKDACPAGPVGAHVTETGCPLDGDSDGVADGLDDCPQTTSGLKVDGRGCVDLSLFAQPMVLNIRYQSGSFEIDRQTKSKLNQLALMLQAAPGVNLEIIGYTDNIGSSQANRALSEKRARRALDYLKGLGIASDRMVARGRGETNFIADNATAKGRQKNRRIEILFLRK